MKRRSGPDRSTAVKKANAVVDVWAQEFHRFVDASAETLQANERGDVAWLEHGLRETFQGLCRDVLRWLLALPGLRVPSDRVEPGECRIGGQERVAHSHFGDVPLVRNYKHRPAERIGPQFEKFLREPRPSGESIFMASRRRVAVRMA